MVLNPTGEAWRGVNALIDNYASIGKDDKVIVVYTDEGKNVAAWVSAALEIRKIDASSIWMAPFQDTNFLERFLKIVPKPDAVSGNIVLLIFEVETLSHSADISRGLCKFDAENIKVFRIMSSIPELFSSAMLIDPIKLSAINATILNRCMRTDTLRVKCDGGTDVEIKLDNSKYHWISNRGVWRPGSSIILPAGEVATFPADVNGTLVADVAYNINTISDRDVRLNKHPVTVVVENSVAVSHFCDDQDTWQYIDECFKSTNGNIIGELGFGTNNAITVPIPENSQINERFPGIHFGFGQHNQGEKVDYYSERHIDLIAKGGKIWTNDGIEPLDLANIVPSFEDHPLVQAEDAFAADEVLEGDCCGLIH